MKMQRHLNFFVGGLSPALDILFECKFALEKLLESMFLGRTPAQWETSQALNPPTAQGNPDKTGANSSTHIAPQNVKLHEPCLVMPIGIDC